MNFEKLFEENVLDVKEQISYYRYLSEIVSEFSYNFFKNNTWTQNLLLN